MGVGGAQAIVEGFSCLALVFMEMRSMVMVMPMIVVGMAVDRAVGMHVFMHMLVIVGMVMVMFVAFDSGFALAASAYRAHVYLSKNYSTSRSLTRISVPPVACTW